MLAWLVAEGDMHADDADDDWHITVHHHHHHKKHGKKVDQKDSESKENISNENVILKNLMKNNMITKQCEYCTEFPDDYSVRNMSNPAKYVTNL